MRGEIARRKGDGYREMREEIKKETTARKKVKVESTIVKGMVWQRLKKCREKGTERKRVDAKETRMCYAGPKESLKVKRRQWA